jgi:predicted nucleic acid-binding protein
VKRSFFFDTSALVKLYHCEVGTAEVEALFQQTEEAIVISELAIVELHSMFGRKVRTGEVSLHAQVEALRNFESDCLHRFTVAPLSSAVLQRAKALLQTHGNSKALRTLDSLQNVACLSAGATEGKMFVCADTRLLKVAQIEGLLVMNPEESRA